MPLSFSTLDQPGERFAIRARWRMKTALPASRRLISPHRSLLVVAAIIALGLVAAGCSGEDEVELPTVGERGTITWCRFKASLAEWVRSDWEQYGNVDRSTVDELDEYVADLTRYCTQHRLIPAERIISWWWVNRGQILTEYGLW